MIRGMTSTILWVSVAGAIGVGLFFVKHKVTDQEHQLAVLNHDIQSNEEEIHVLKAEWSYLNDPARLRTLAERYLDMRPITPTQIATLDTLPDGPAVASAHSHPSRSLAAVGSTPATQQAGKTRHAASIPALEHGKRIAIATVPALAASDFAPGREGRH